MSKTVRTACPYCGVGCGVLATRNSNGSVDIAGDPEHPANFGRLCTKGAALGETVSLEGRVLKPLVMGEPASWNGALDLVAERFSQTIAEHGPDSVAFYVSGQLLTEDYYVANKLMKGFIGSANIDTNSRLCMASSVAGHKRAFGSDTVPGNYEDIELADVVVLVGSNLAWCHPVLFQRLAAARLQKGTKVVVVDPRRTATCEIADMHLAIAPGSDVALFNGLLTQIVGANAVDRDYTTRHTNGYADATRAARETCTRAIARETGISQIDLFRFYDLFIAHERVVTIYSQGVNQSSAGTDKVNAIINCHLATGRIGKPGMGPFSVTGQPNAMGGRETGGLANMLAAHMEIDNPAHREIVQGFWRSPAIAAKPGLKAVDMFRAVGDGRIKALWIMATNPVDSMPEADAVADALARCPFVVVSDVVRHTDTTALAHVLLPALAWGEKDGTVTNSERRISRQRAFLAPPGEARADWWQLAEVGRRMGFAPAFAWTRPSEIFAEYAALTGVANAGTRDLDISAFAAIDAGDYDRLAPVQWPRQQGEPSRETRFFADGGYFTPDRKARMVPTPWRANVAAADPDFPLLLNTGRIRDQWHTMTRTAKTPRLMGHIAEPFVEVHPRDAALLGLASASLARLESRHGSAVLRVNVTDRQQPGTIFAPMHWTDQLASSARVDALVQADVDPVSGQPALKSSRVRLEPYAPAWYAFAVMRHRPAPPNRDYWALAPARSGWRIEFAGLRSVEDWSAVARDLLIGLDCPVRGDMDLLAYHDAATGQHRFAAFDGEKLLGLLFIGRHPVEVARTWAADQLDATVATPNERLRLLAGRGGADAPDRGATVCACFDVGQHEIAAAALQGDVTVDAIGATLKAGTNCGSCRIEIGRIIDAARLQKAG